VLFRRGIALRADLALVHENLGRALRAAGDRAGAVVAFESALRLDPSLPTAREALAALRADLPAAAPP
jgi:lipoprotein NlpI